MFAIILGEFNTVYFFSCVNDLTVVLEDMLIICGLLLTQGDVYLLMSKCKGNF